MVGMNPAGILLVLETGRLGANHRTGRRLEGRYRVVSFKPLALRLPHKHADAGPHHVVLDNHDHTISGI